MAQKILIRRGGIDNLSATIGVSKGELIYASGSTNGVENVVFIANADGNNTFTAVNKLYSGTAAANSFNSSLNGVPYYNTDSQAIYILNNGGSNALDLSGNLEGTQISSIEASGSFSGSFTGNGSGLTNLSLGSITAPGNDTEILYNNGGAIAATSNLKVTATTLNAAALDITTTGDVSASNLLLSGNANIDGNIVLGGNINIGNADTDFVNFGAEVTSNFIPDADGTYDLGSDTKRWNFVYTDYISASNHADFGDVEIYGALAVKAGYTSFGNWVTGTNFSASGDIYINNDLTVDSGDLYLKNYSPNRITYIYNDVDGNKLVTSPDLAYDGTTFDLGQGDFTVGISNGNTKIAGTLVVTGSATLNSTLSVATGISSSGWIHAAGALDVDGTSTLTGNVGVGGTLTVAGQTDLNGDINLGNAATDTVTFVADVDSNIIPSANATYNIGGPSDKWLNGYFVSASIDSLEIGGINPTAQDLDDVMNNGNSTNNDFILNNNGNQAITHTGATGNLTISSTNGNVYVEGALFSGNNLTVPGNLTVQGTTTTIDSTTVNIGDNIIVLNAAGAVDGGVQVVDVTGGTTGTGSLLWNSTDDYWYAGMSGSTHHRIVEFVSGGGLTDNYLPKSANDGSKRLTNSIISDNGTTATIHGNISGSLLQVNTGIEATGLTGVIDTSSRAIFRDGSNRLGALSTSDSAVAAATFLAYKADGTFIATSVIDGGTF